MVRIILSHFLIFGYDPQIRGWKGQCALHPCCEFIRKKCTRLLLSRGADIDFLDIEGSPSLFSTIYYNRYLSLQALLANDPRPNFPIINKASAILLHIAAEKADVQMIEMLIEPGLQRAVDTAIKNSDGDTAEEIVERRHDLSPEIKLAFEA